MSNSNSGADSTSAPNNNQTEMLCRFCEQPMEYKPWLFNGKDLSIVTCMNFECCQFKFTFAASSYPTRDLTPYCDSAVNSPSPGIGEGARG